jgi:hypothetical protein
VIPEPEHPIYGMKAASEHRFSSRPRKASQNVSSPTNSVTRVHHQGEHGKERLNRFILAVNHPRPPCLLRHLTDHDAILFFLWDKRKPMELNLYRPRNDVDVKQTFSQGRRGIETRTARLPAGSLVELTELIPMGDRKLARVFVRHTTTRDIQERSVTVGASDLWQFDHVPYDVTRIDIARYAAMMGPINLAIDSLAPSTREDTILSIKGSPRYLLLHAHKAPHLTQIILRHERHTKTFTVVTQSDNPTHKQSCLYSVSIEAKVEMTNEDLCKTALAYPHETVWPPQKPTVNSVLCEVSGGRQYMVERMSSDGLRVNRAPVFHAESQDEANTWLTVFWVVELRWIVGLFPREQDVIEVQFPDTLVSRDQFATRLASTLTSIKDEVDAAITSAFETSQSFHGISSLTEPVSGCPPWLTSQVNDAILDMFKDVYPRIAGTLMAGLKIECWEEIADQWLSKMDDLKDDMKTILMEKRERSGK